MNFLKMVFVPLLFLIFLTLGAAEPLQKLKIIVVGAGGQQGMEYLEELMQRSNVEVVAAVVYRTIPQKIQEMGIGIFSGGDVEEVLAKVDFDTESCLFNSFISLHKPTRYGLHSDKWIDCSKKIG